MKQQRSSEEGLAIHAGIQKSGSTYLQTVVFPLLFPEMPRSAKGSVKCYESVRFLQGDDMGLPLISDEGLSTHLSPRYAGEGWDKFCRFITRSRQLAQPPRILLVIRRHQDWFESAYLQRAWRRGEGPGEWIKRFDFLDVSWSRRIEALSSVPSLVVLQEDLLKYPLEVITMISSFWGRTVPQTAIVDLVGSRRPVNKSPRNLLGIGVLRTERILRSVVSAAVRRTSFGAIHPRWRNKVFRQWLIDQTNRLSGVRACRIVLPPALARDLQEDWNRALSQAKRPASAVRT